MLKFEKSKKRSGFTEEVRGRDVSGWRGGERVLNLVVSIQCSRAGICTEYCSKPMNAVQDEHTAPPLLFPPTSPSPPLSALSSVQRFLLLSAQSLPKAAKDGSETSREASRLSTSSSVWVILVS